VCDHFVPNMDMVTTVLDAADVARPDTHDGRSLVPLLGGGPDDCRDDVYCQFSGYRVLATMRMVRWQHYKYVFNAHDHDERYDLARDPSELTNVIADPAYDAVADEGRGRLIRLANASGEAIHWPMETMLRHGVQRPDARWSSQGSPWKADGVRSLDLNPASLACHGAV